MRKVLREQWGFDSILVSDYMAISQLHRQHHTSSDRAEASAAAIKAGMDVELPNPICYYNGIEEALRFGYLGMAEIDECVQRHLYEKLRLFAQPYANENLPEQVLHTQEHVDLAEKAAADSFIVLKNTGILSLDAKNTSKNQKVALIGQCAADQLSLFCGYSFPIHLIHSDTAAEKDNYAETLADVLPRFLPQAQIDYQIGAPILKENILGGEVFPNENTEDSLEDVLQQKIVSIQSEDLSQILAAVQSAQNADVAILNLGDRTGLFRSGTVGEGSGASSLALPGKQEELLRAVLAAGRPTIVILQCGQPYIIPPDLLEELAAVLLVWLPGEKVALAIAKTLSGGVQSRWAFECFVSQEPGCCALFL